MADVVTEVNYVVYRVCFWERLSEVLLEETSYLCDIELSKDRLLVFSSLVITVKEKLRKISFVGKGDLPWCFALSSDGAAVASSIRIKLNLELSL